MPQVINTNVASLNAQRNLNTSQTALATSLQRLSTGLRINSAKDDAAGLAISERFSTQIRGLTQASRNANDGISLAQTAEGALAEVTNNLQRIRELAVQARNATNSASDRAALDAEVQQRLAEVNRVASQTQFNGLNLLNGTFTSQVFQVGANQGQTITVSSIASATGQALGLNGGSLARFTHTGTAVTAALNAGDLTVNGADLGAVAGDAKAIATAINALDNRYGATATNAQTAIAFTDVVGTAASAANPTTSGAGAGVTNAGVAAASETFTLQVDGLTFYTETDGGGGGATISAADLNGAAAAFVLANTGYTFAGDFSAGTAVLSKTDGTDMTIAITSNFTGTAVDLTGFVGTKTNGDPAVPGVAPNYTLTLDGAVVDLSSVATDGTITGTEVANAVNSIAGFTASFAGGNLSIAKADGSNFVLAETGTDAATEGLSAASTTYRGTVSINSSIDVAIAGASPAKAGLTAATGGTAASVAYSAINVLTAASADTVLEVVDAALTTVNNSRADLGAIQNRFESVIANLATTSENLTASRSRIMDADFAAETAALTRSQILQQAGVAMLAQANALPQNVLSLLRG